VIYHLILSKYEFDDNCIDFIFSEHFFEHIFFDEAISLLKECHRILKPFGVIRMVVPDADIRIYEPPEMIGHPSIKMPYTHLSKHKTRWSIYLLSEALKIDGFKPILLHFCDKYGKHHCYNSLEFKEEYKKSPDKEMIFILHRTYAIHLVKGLKKIRIRISFA